jgi:GT2 family glycosyltransferase
MTDQATVGVVVVTHDSEAYLAPCLAALQSQTLRPAQVVVVDNGSANPRYLDPWEKEPGVRVLRDRNLGFCEGNNRGAALLVDTCAYVLFLNPDCFVDADCLWQLCALMGQPEHQAVGVAGVSLRGFDIAQGAPTGLMDCTGVFQKWYGLWYSREQGRPMEDCRHEQPEEVPAITGALMFCRARALKQVQLSANEFFDRRFFMYKEDIDLALRLRKHGWSAVYFPALHAFHCRGWHRNQERRNVPRAVRRMAARNECRLPTNNVLRNPFSVKWMYSICKYLYVSFVEP